MTLWKNYALLRALRSRNAPTIRTPLILPILTGKMAPSSWWTLAKYLRTCVRARCSMNRSAVHCRYCSLFFQTYEEAPFDPSLSVFLFRIFIRVFFLFLRILCLFFSGLVSLSLILVSCSFLCRSCCGVLCRSGCRRFLR